MKTPSAATAPTSAAPTRRKFLGWGLVSTIFAALGWRLAQRDEANVMAVAGSKSAQSGGLAGAAAQPQALTGRAAFVPLLHTEFSVTDVSSHTDAKLLLVEVSAETKTSGHLGSFVTYSLLFKAPDTFLTEGGTCRLAHESMQPTEFFMSPVGRAKNNSRHLEATFSYKV
jgi:hypothetical protein